MPVPKRRMSRSNTRARRSQWKTSRPSLVACSNPACRKPRLPHNLCKACGWYGNRAVVEV